MNNNMPTGFKSYEQSQKVWIEKICMKFTCYVSQLYQKSLTNYANDYA